MVQFCLRGPHRSAFCYCDYCVDFRSFTTAVFDMDAMAMLRLLPPGVLRQEQQRKKTRLCKRLTYARGFSAAAKRARAQSLNFNRSGGARTRDHQMPIIVPGKRSPQKPPKIKGSGQWKSSTPEYICKMGEAPPEIPQKILPALQGGSQGHKRGCSFVISDLVMSKHEELAAERHTHSV